MSSETQEEADERWFRGGGLGDPSGPDAGEGEEVCAGCGRPYLCPSDCPTGTYMRSKKPSPQATDPEGVVDRLAESDAYNQSREAGLMHEAIVLLVTQAEEIQRLKRSVASWKGIAGRNRGRRYDGYDPLKPVVMDLRRATRHPETEK